MPSGPAVIKDLEARGLNGAFLSGVVKRGRGAGLFKVSGKGGGISTAHWDETDLGHLVASLAGDQPSDVEEAIAILYPLILVSAKSEDEDGQPGAMEPFQRDLDNDPPGAAHDQTFGQFIEKTIRILSEVKRAEDARAKVHGVITLSLEPPHASVDISIDGERRLYSFAAPRKVLVENQNRLLDFNYIPKTPLWRWRTTTLPADILVSCADLLARTPASMNASSAEGEAPASADHEDGDESSLNNNAPSPARPEASTLNNQPRETATGVTSNPEIREVGTTIQSPFSRGWSLPSKDPASCEPHFRLTA
jgi:hypothetical protein